MSDDIRLIETLLYRETQAVELLQGLEALREELGTIADDLILLLRDAGVTPTLH